MEHSEAVKQMAVERYLLKELTPEEREAFEEHVFDCPECALDLSAGAAFVDEAKVQLPAVTVTSPEPSPGTRKPRTKWDGWFSWMRPAFAAPAFAALLLVLGYQNLVTFPALRSAADQPHLLPAVPLHGATRGDERMTITADRSHGIALPFDFYRQPDSANYSSYAFDLYDPQGKLAWTGAIPVPGGDQGSDERISLAIPGAMLQNGVYTIVVSGIGSHEERTEVERHVFDVHLTY